VVVRSKVNAMKSISLLEVTVEQLNGEQPTVGSEVVLRGVRYRVMNVKPPRDRSSKWGLKKTNDQEEKWQLLVEKVEEAESSMTLDRDG